MRSDVDNYDGTLATSRVDSTGGTQSGLKVFDAIDVLSVFGSGDTDNMTDTTISLATSTLGSANHALSFAPGTWTISNTITIASNFTLIVPAGCVFSVASGKTMTVQGVFFRQHATYSGGAGTFTISGTDLLAATSSATDYAADTGAADAYVITLSPSPASYTTGRLYAFKATNTNTGASTLNVNSLGAKTIKTLAGADLPAETIVANGIYECRYDGTNMQLLIGHPLNIVGDTTPQLGAALDTNSFGINESYATVASHATTADIWASTNVINWTGTATTTDFADADQAGQRRTLICAGACAITAGANMLIDGVASGSTYTATAGDKFHVTAISTTQFRVAVERYTALAGKAPVLSNGTKSSGTFTPDPTLGEFQSYTNGGAHTLAPPSVNGSIIMTITNNASAGAITTSGFTAVRGDAFTTTDTNIFICGLYYDGTSSLLRVTAMQ